MLTFSQTDEDIRRGPDFVIIFSAPAIEGGRRVNTPGSQHARGFRLINGWIVPTFHLSDLLSPVFLRVLDLRGSYCETAVSHRPVLWTCPCPCPRSSPLDRRQLEFPLDGNYQRPWRTAPRGPSGDGQRRASQEVEEVVESGTEPRSRDGESRHRREDCAEIFARGAAPQRDQSGSDVADTGTAVEALARHRGMRGGRCSSLRSMSDQAYRTEIAIGQESESNVNLTEAVPF
jgi:hypothetical protein